jgi:K(+)-stimulated pyrophosphate-energized sodium pump
MMGLFIGGMLPFFFSSLAMKAVGSAANKMIEEVRRQFREIDGLLEGKAEPEAAKCVEIATAGSIRQMVAPGLLAVLAPIVLGLLFGKAAVGGLLAGALVSGVMMALFMANAGGAWDNAKKFIESGEYGGKGSEPHKAAVVGDTVGDPFKDTAGPAINILIKLMTIVALVFLPVFESPWLV